MKTLMIFVTTMLVALSLQAQENDINTYSVSLGDFINFIVDHYEYQDPEEENEANKNIVFLIQVANTDISAEDMIILKQGFKLLSERLNDYNSISILTYFGYNGIAMDFVAPSELDDIYDTLSDLKSSIDEFHNDGIELAYKYVNENYVEDAESSIVIVRNPKTINLDLAVLSKTEIKKLKRKKKKKEIMKVAVSLLPEIIAILKN